MMYQVIQANSHRLPESAVDAAFLLSPANRTVITGYNLYTEKVKVVSSWCISIY